jgi:hypothetical protein
MKKKQQQNRTVILIIIRTTTKTHNLIMLFDLDHEQQWQYTHTYIKKIVGRWRNEKSFNLFN